MHLATGKRCTDAGSGDILLLYDASSIVLHACNYCPLEEKFFNELLIRTADHSRAGEMKGVRDHQNTCEVHSGDVEKWDVACGHVATWPHALAQSAARLRLLGRQASLTPNIIHAKSPVICALQKQGGKASLCIKPASSLMPDTQLWLSHRVGGSSRGQETCRASQQRRAWGWA